MDKVARVHQAYRSDRTHIAFLFLDEMDAFATMMVESVGEPPRSDSVFLAWNSLNVKATKAYREKCKAFYRGWIAAKPSSVCNELMDPK